MSYFRRIQIFSGAASIYQKTRVAGLLKVFASHAIEGLARRQLCLIGTYLWESFAQLSWEQYSLGPHIDVNIMSTSRTTSFTPSPRITFLNIIKRM
jgi:hypothetical protein